MLPNLIKDKWSDINKIYFYVKDSFELIYQLLAKGTEKVGIKYTKNPNVFIDYSQQINDGYKRFHDNNPIKEKSVNSFFMLW